MDTMTYQYVSAHPEILAFVRKHPIWYRLLARDPDQLGELVREARIYYGRTFPQRVEKIQEHIQMVQMLLKLSEVMKD